MFEVLQRFAPGCYWIVGWNLTREDARVLASAAPGRFSQPQD